MEQKKKARPQERRSRKFEKEASRRKRPQMEAEPSAAKSRASCRTMCSSAATP